MQGVDGPPATRLPATRLTGQAAHTVPRWTRHGGQLDLKTTESASFGAGRGLCKESSLALYDIELHFRPL